MEKRFTLDLLVLRMRLIRLKTLDIVTGLVEHHVSCVAGTVDVDTALLNFPNHWNLALHAENSLPLTHAIPIWIPGVTSSGYRSIQFCVTCSHRSFRDEVVYDRLSHPNSYSRIYLTVLYGVRIYGFLAVVRESNDRSVAVVFGMLFA
jgi:hypothetical protein